MGNDFANLLREWLRAEIDAKIADAQEGSDGYYGTGYAENKEADRLFALVREQLTQSRRQN